MKLTKDRLKQIIKEELEEMISEAPVPGTPEYRQAVDAERAKIRGSMKPQTSPQTPPSTDQLKPGDQVKFKDPDNLSGQILGKILTNKQGLDFLDDASARNTSDFVRYGSDGTKKLNDPSGEYFFINPLRSIRQNGLGQPKRSFYVIEKSLLTKS